MGQKANPVLLRLKTTNKNFDSCWYSDLHYSTLLSLELRARSYIEKVFEQIRYPKPLISLSLIPKRGKVLTFYLNPERLRGQRNERFQLKSFMPPRNVESHAHHLPSRSTEASHMLGFDGGVRTLRSLLVKGSLLDGEPRSSSWKPGINQVQPNRPWERPPGSYKEGGWMPNWERRLFIYSTLLSITKRRSNTVRLLFDKDFTLFHRVEDLVWFQGREESYLSSTNRRLPINDKQAGGTLTRANKSKGRGIPFSRSRGSLTTHWSAGAPSPLTRDGHQVGKSSSRGSSLSRGSYTTQAPLARGLHTCCARGLPLIRGLTDTLTSPPVVPAQLSHSGSNLIKRNKDIMYWVNTDTRAVRSVYTTTSFISPTETAREVEARSSAGHSSPGASKRRGWGSLTTPALARCGHRAPADRATGRRGPTDEPLVRRRALVPEIGVKSNRLDGYLWPKPSIREIRRGDAHSSICFMEIALGRGLGISTTIYPYKSIEEEQTAQFLSEEIAYYLERRIPFRRIKQALIRELQKKYIEGIKVSCSGRVGGRSKKAQRSREESFQWGQTSSHVFSSKLSFASRSALTPFGKVGIKVWICYK
ncbi:Ribosomal protein S3 (mitochondrion) [Coccomyxa sp. Obi]|nr:Ribosomal protein S3 [Coccomyxa sp. Obi]